MSAVPTSIVLFAFWLALTGSFAPIELVIGVVISLAVGIWAARRIWPAGAFAITPMQSVRLVGYLGHLLKSVLVAAIQVAEVVFDPAMPVEPVMITHRAPFRREVSRLAFANSITLTPGTITVDVDGDSYVVHCLSESFADEIVSGELERRIARVFEE